MKNLKKSAAILLAASTMLVTASAQPTPTATDIYINGAAIETPGTFKTEDGLFIPLRAVCESLGFTVTWHGDSEKIEIVNLPVYITCSPNYDGYTFSKMAPAKLGTAPFLINDTTYVPAGFIDEILQGSYTVDAEGAIRILYGDTQSVTILEKAEDHIVVSDFQHGDVVVYADENTIITNAAGEALTLDALEEGRALQVLYAETMTMSLPPVTTAMKIVQLDALGNTAVEGTVSELVYEDEKLIQILIENEGGQLALNVDDTTEFTAADASALKEGTAIRAWASAMTTMSIPAQRFAARVLIFE